jgi:serine/threonine-protein kinase
MTRLRSVAWRRLQEVFDAAADLEPAARAALLDERCAGDPELRRQVESLLLHVDGDDGRVEAAVDRAMGQAADAWAAPLVGTRVGPYRLEREIGEGGMGTVYLAVRADDEYKKRVAVKLLRAGLLGSEMRTRFRSERQILAQLDHPSIARLIDGGTTDAGTPYLVMEYVDGQPITAWCEARRLPVEDRLRLFREVCGAVQYAHAHLVVHRDLKPSNILVTEDGTPKLLDFGIAKILADEAELGYTVPVTRAAERLMTPEYASPEQVRGEPVTTGSDVYALGVVLYELLAGRRPFAFDRGNLSEIERRVTEEAAPAPNLGDDLDNIVLLALDKDPARRYASVEHFSEDIRRYLDGLPVVARPATLRYRAGKFVRRHRAAVAAAMAFIVLLAAYAVTMAVTASRLARERDRALTAEREAQQVSSFLTQIFEIADPSEQRGRTITAVEILDQGAARIQKELAGQPRVQAALMDTIGRVYQNLGAYDAAARQFGLALDIRRLELGEDALDTLQTKNNAAEILREQSRFKEAEALHREVLAARERLLPPGDPKMAETLNNLALVLQQSNRFTEAEPLYARALDIRRRALGERHEDTTVTMSNLGQTWTRLGRLAEAEAIYRKVLEIRRAELGADHPRTLNSMHVLGGVLDDTGDFAEAEALYRDALAQRRRILGPTHPATAMTANNLASLLHDQGNLDAAEPLYREALAAQRERLGEDSMDVAISLNNLASLLESRGDPRAAEPMYRQSLAIREKLLGPRNAAVARARHNLGRALVAQGRVEEGERNMRASLATRRELLGPDHPDVAVSLLALSALAHDRRQLGTAETLARDALGIRLKKYGETNPQTALAQSALGAVLVDRGAAAEAEPLLRAALDSLRKPLPADHVDVARAELALGRCLAALGRREEAVALMRRARDSFTTRLGAGNRQTRDAVRALARIE